MGHETLDGYMLASMFRTGMIAVSQHQHRINQLNVFPVADGDTGTNLLYTLKAMVDQAKKTHSFADALRNLSEAGMAQAMGNSGIIFASYIYGMAESGKGSEAPSLAEFAQIAHQAVGYAYFCLAKLSADIHATRAIGAADRDADPAGEPIPWSCIIRT